MYTANITVPTKELTEWLLDSGYLPKSFSEADLIELKRDASGINAQGYNFKMYDNMIFNFETRKLKE